MKKRILDFYKFITFVMSFMILLISSSYSQDVPANLQAALFKKIFAFNKTLSGKSVEVAVLGSSGGDIAAAFKDAGVNAKAVDQVPAGAVVVYVMPGATAPKQKGVFTISGDASYVESGKVSVGIGVEGGKPKIIVHLAQLKAEGQELSADLLKIAKVIQ